MAETMFLTGRASMDEVGDHADGNFVAWKMLVEKAICTISAMVTHLGIVYLGNCFGW